MRTRSPPEGAAPLDLPREAPRWRIARADRARRPQQVQRLTGRADPVERPGPVARSHAPTPRSAQKSNPSTWRRPWRAGPGPRHRPAPRRAAAALPTAPRSEPIRTRDDRGRGLVVAVDVGEALHGQKRRW